MPDIANVPCPAIVTLRPPSPWGNSWPCVPKISFTNLTLLSLWWVSVVGGWLGWWYPFFFSHPPHSIFILQFPAFSEPHLARCHSEHPFKQANPLRGLFFHVSHQYEGVGLTPTPADLQKLYCFVKPTEALISGRYGEMIRCLSIINDNRKVLVGDTQWGRQVCMRVFFLPE